MHTPPEPTEQAFRCPICGGDQRIEHRGRADARCTSCGSLERTRYLWLYLNRAAQLAQGMAVLHAAPEKSISSKLRALVGGGYDPVDLDPARYTTSGVIVRKLDMCTDLVAIPDGAYDVVLHMHVLEHLPCTLAPVLANTLRILKPGGSFIFSVPVYPGGTTEDMSADVSAEDRLRRFGQEDHIRRLGTLDFPPLLESIFRAYSEPGEYLVDPDLFSSPAELEQAGIPAALVRAMTFHSLFHVRKRLALEPRGSHTA